MCRRPVRPRRARALHAARPPGPAPSKRCRGACRGANHNKHRTRVCAAHGARAPHTAPCVGPPLVRPASAARASWRAPACGCMRGGCPAQHAPRPGARPSGRAARAHGSRRCTPAPLHACLRAWAPGARLNSPPPSSSTPPPGGGRVRRRTPRCRPCKRRCAATQLRLWRVQPGPLLPPCPPGLHHSNPPPPHLVRTHAQCTLELAPAPPRWRSRILVAAHSKSVAHAV